MLGKKKSSHVNKLQFFSRSAFWSFFRVSKVHMSARVGQQVHESALLVKVT